MDKQDTQKLLQQLGKEAKRRQEEAAAQAWGRAGFCGGGGQGYAAEKQ